MLIFHIMILALEKDIKEKMKKGSENYQVK